ncbi:rod shape-determining protein RodA [Marispirochaeta aestuarii]|uniref:Peptidoglycan glycosyltransferase RodA n=1 Tax=Marispirochaeta aestuarii TaxID=1963862 RepID=A0A1Y1S1G2_9SPIO|nr:rod shape-determining protein RodA [Marispirochaeta aestuarii]ORC36599.1 rod shape-determining protein RodA [Marispirochaeta aestuarii]
MKLRSFLGFDIFIFLSVIALMLIGVLFIYSSGVSSSGIVYSNEYIKQIISISIGLVLCLLFSFGNYSRLGEWSLYFYLAGILVLVYTLVFGKVVNGARAWITLGSFHVGQPSELMKILTILYLGYFFDQHRNSIRKLSTLFMSLGIVALPMGLILLQPDMGTALVFVPIYLFSAFIALVPLRYLFFLVLSGFLTIILGILPEWNSAILHNEGFLIRILTEASFWPYLILVAVLITILSLIGFISYHRKYFYWTGFFAFSSALSFIGAFLMQKVLKDYQIMRLIVFLDPEIDPRGTGWHIIQSITAVGSGGLYGKGFLQGTQSQYRFLPMQSTDFIFSIIAEEWGFIGSFLILLLFTVVLLRGIYIIWTAKDRYGKIVGAGIVGMLFFHMVVNIGMTMGIMPITGIPLPFVSYGGSSILNSLISIGILLNIHQRRYHF